MRDNNPPAPQKSVDVAREAFSRLARQRITPTPDNYRDIYNEIIGIAAESSAETVLANFAQQLIAMPIEMAALGKKLKRALDARDWSDYSTNLAALGKSHLMPKPVFPALLPTNQPINKVTVMPAASMPPAPADVDTQVKLLREMLVRTLGYAVPPLLLNAPELVTEAEALAALVKEARGESLLNDITARLKKFCFKLDIKGSDLSKQHDLLLDLFKLLMDNIKELLDDDSWLQGQVMVVQNLVDGPITHLALKDATTTLKEVIYKQGLLKHSLSDAKVTVKSMMITFVDRLGEVAVSTGDYHEKIDQYSQKISQAQDIKQLNEILNDVMRDTKTAQTDALRYRDEMTSVRNEVQQAEDRIHSLESKLDKMSELVREDQLTGSLNRRGLDDVFEREFARVDRMGGDLCIAMLDLDDFKRLNDTYGHSAGDDALIYLVNVIKETLRALDVVGRFGGEEFLIILPDTSLPMASQTITRLQLDLTKRIFMVNEERLLITFSAGVAARRPAEDRADLIKRADAALYEAKKAGKNRVAKAE